MLELKKNPPTQQYCNPAPSSFSINSEFLNRYVSILVYRIEVQAQINIQVGEFLKINKRAVQNKCPGETSCIQLSNVQDLMDVQ